MKKSRNEMMVGFFVIVGFVMFALVVFFVSGVYLFRSGYSVSIIYDYVDIMDKGAPVRMAGVRVGEVSKIELVEDEATQYLRVKASVFIDSRFTIRENYKFEVRGTHVLSEPHIEITPVPGEAPLLKDGAVIQGEKLLPMEDLIKNMHNVSRGMDQIVNGDLEDAPGDMKQMVLQLKGAAETLSSTLKKMEQGNGTAGKLVSSDELYQDMRAFFHEIKAHPWRLLKKDNKYDKIQKGSGAAMSPAGTAQVPAPRKRRFFFF